MKNYVRSHKNNSISSWKYLKFEIPQIKIQGVLFKITLVSNSEANQNIL